MAILFSVHVFPFRHAIIVSNENHAMLCGSKC